jgi:SAM-dependent methyltransferase
MGIIGGKLGYWLLRIISPGTGFDGGQGVYESKSKIDTFFGPEFWQDVVGKNVIDFGCGTGQEAVEMTKRGARHVIGIDIRESVLGKARELAHETGVSDRCMFKMETKERVDTITSFDAFEHFSDPDKILNIISRLIHPTGCVWIVFGPPWYHPRGGHLFSVFPWAHLVFTESALIRWRTDFKTDGARRFCEVAGGLNQMSVARFNKTVKASPFRFDRIELIPIHALRWLANPLTKDFVTSSVKCRLVLRRQI